MPFWRSWGAALLGASGVALLVPLGLLLVVLVAAGVSGTTGFGKLGQVTAGPALPGGGGLSVRDGARLPTVPRARALTPGAARAARRAPASGPTSRTAGRPPVARRPSSGRTPSGGTSTGVNGSGTPAPTGPGSGLAPAAPAAPTPAAPTALLPAVVAGVQQLLKPLPVVGPVAADAVGSVAGLILPPGPPPPRSP